MCKSPKLCFFVNFGTTTQQIGIRELFSSFYRSTIPYAETHQLCVRKSQVKFSFLRQQILVCQKHIYQNFNETSFTALITDDEIIYTFKWSAEVFAKLFASNSPPNRSSRSFIYCSNRCSSKAWYKKFLTWMLFQQLYWRTMLPNLHLLSLASIKFSMTVVKQLEQHSDSKSSPETIFPSQSFPW